MRVFENTKGVDLMIWETNPRMRNKNNEIKFLSNQKHSEGDVIVCLIGDDGTEVNISSYELTNIKEQRDSVTGRNYVTADSKWSRMPVKNVLDSLSENTRKRALSIQSKIDQQKN